MGLTESWMEKRKVIWWTFSPQFSFFLSSFGLLDAAFFNFLASFALWSTAQSSAAIVQAAAWSCLCVNNGLSATALFSVFQCYDANCNSDIYAQGESKLGVVSFFLLFLQEIDLKKDYKIKCILPCKLKSVLKCAGKKNVRLTNRNMMALKYVLIAFSGSLE